jgi:hypothetical protein
MIHYTSLHHKISCTHMLTLQVAMCFDVPHCIIFALMYYVRQFYTSPLIRAYKLSVMFSYSAMQLHSQLTAKICQTIISKFCHNFSQSNRTSPLPNYDIIFCVNYIVLYSSEQTMVKCYFVLFP